MEIRDFAQRILFAGTLEEKLLTPPEGKLTDLEPGTALLTVDAPGRPAGLHFSARGERARLPRADELHGAEARAVLLHAFANHELLAVELMALALLKFPDAPPEFRRGLVRTLREEQEHTRLYMERMAASGLKLGDLPVNGFFWRNIAGMTSPMDYVSLLSLTFEQANLDYSRHYAQVFHQLGDAETGGLLDRIYRDEIAHVGYGLKWFRRWKDPSRSDWEAWAEGLAFPVSPARGKGNAPFNREGRRRAGLDADFIARMELFSHSKGRTPWVGWFNPAAEACALANRAEAAGEESTTAALARDLDLLPAFSLHSEDVVLVNRKPSDDHLRRLRDAGISLPQWEVLEGRGGKFSLAADSPLRTRKLGRLRPWAWSADSAELLAPLLANAGEAAFASIPWDAEIRALYAKTTAAGVAAVLCRELGFPEEECAGRRAASVEEVEAALKFLEEAGHGRACLKSPYGIAGRGIVQVSTGGLAERDLTWLRPVLFHQKEVVVEPWLERIADFSSQYELEPGARPRLKGQVRLINDAGGRFLGCRAGASFSRLLPGEAARLMHETGTEQLFRDQLPAVLAELPGMSRLHGGLGIDSFFYRDPASGAARLRPLVEINPRTTMGRVTLDLRRYAASAGVVSFRILHRRAAKAAGFASLADQARSLMTADPPVLTDTASGPRLTRGTLPLNDPSRAEAFLAVLTVHERPPRPEDAGPP